MYSLMISVYDPNFDLNLSLSYLQLLENTTQRPVFQSIISLMKWLVEDLSSLKSKCATFFLLKKMRGAKAPHIISAKKNK